MCKDRKCFFALFLGELKIAQQYSHHCFTPYPTVGRVRLVMLEMSFFLFPLVDASFHRNFTSACTNNNNNKLHAPDAFYLQTFPKTQAKRLHFLFAFSVLLSLFRSPAYSSSIKSFIYANCLHQFCTLFRRLFAPNKRAMFRRCKTAPCAPLFVFLIIAFAAILLRAFSELKARRDAVT